MVSSSSNPVGNGGIDPGFFNLSLDEINQTLEERKPSELVEIFARAVEHLNVGKSKQVALLVVEKLNHKVKPSMGDDLCQRIGEVFRRFLDTSLTKSHNNSLEKDEAKIVVSILKGGLATNSLVDSLYKTAQFKRADLFEQILEATAGTHESVTDGRGYTLLV
jgi:hypothetical protein